MGFVFIGFVLSELFWFVERNSAAKEQGNPRQELIFKPRPGIHSERASFPSPDEAPPRVFLSKLPRPA
jgi:hypothetical protein